MASSHDMKPMMTKEEAKRYVDGWKAVNKFQRHERLSWTMEDRWQQLMTLVAMLPLFPADSHRESEAIDVRKRWKKLQEKMA